MMENPLFHLNSVSASWLNPSFTPWAVDMILAIVCGLGLFLLLLPCLPGDPSFPPPRKKEKLWKHTKVKKKQSKNKKRSGILKGHSDSWQDVDETEDLVSLLQSHLGKLHDDSSFHQLLKVDDPNKMGKPESARVHQSHTRPVEDPLVAAIFPLASLTSLSKHPLLLASTSSPDLMTSSDSIESPSSLSASQSPESVIPLEQRSPQPHGLSAPPSHAPDPMAHPPSLPGPSLTPQGDSMTLSLGSNPQSSSPPNNSWSSSPVPMPSPGPLLPSVPSPSPGPLPFPVPTISGHVLSTCPISSLSWWQMATRVGCLSHSPQSGSKRENFSHPPEDSFWANYPLSQVEAEGTSFINPDAQKLLEMLISRRAETNICNVKTEGPDYSLNSQGSTVKSLGREQDSTIPQPSWNTKAKPEQLSFPQRLFYTKVLGDHLQKKSSQLFWGLPILHSESLVATVSMPGHSTDFSSIVFNEHPNHMPVQVQATPGQLCPSQLLLHPVVQLQPVTPNLSWSQSPSLVQIQNQDHVTSSLPNLPYHLPLNTACGFSCPKCQEGIQLLSPSALDHLEYHILRKQLESREALPCLVLKSQNVFSHLTSENRDSCDHNPINKPQGDFISLELQEKLDEHLQKRFMLHQYGLPPNIYPFMNLKEPWDRIPRTGQAKDNCGSSWTSVFPNNSSSVQEMDSERPEIIQEGRIPVGVCHSRLCTHNVSDPPGNSNTHKETGNGPSIKGGEAFRNTSQDLSLLGAGTLQVLEAHFTSLRVRHRWGLPLKILKNLNVFKRKNSKASPLPQAALPSSASCDSRADSIAHDANVLGKPTQKGPGLEEVARTSVPTLKIPLSGPSFESLSGIPSGDNCGLPDAPATAQKYSLTSQQVLVGRTWHSNAVLGSSRDSLEPNLSLEMGRHESLGSGGMSSQGSCHSTSSLWLGSQLLKTEKIREIEDEEEESSDWAITMEIRKTSNFQNGPINLGSLESQGTSERPYPSRSSNSQGQGNSCLKAQTEPENQSQELATGVILQDCATDIFHQDCAPEVLLAADILASRERLSSSLSMSSSSASTSQGLYGLLTSDESSQDLEEPKIPEHQDPWKSKTNKFRPTAKGENSVWPRAEAQEGRFVGGRPSHAGSMGPSASVTEVGDTMEDKSSQAPSKRNFGDRIKNFLQHIFLSKGKGQANSLPKITTPSISTQSQEGSVTSRLHTDNAASEAQTLMTTVGWIIEQKMRFHHNPSASKKNMMKKEPQAPVGRQSHSSRGPSSPEQRRVMGAMAHSHQTSPRGHHHPLNKWIRNKDNNQALLLKEPAPLPSPCQHRPRVAGISGHNVHCPRHCALRRHLLSCPHQHASHSCPPGKKVFPQFKPY